MKLDKTPSAMQRSDALFSTCRRYRYWLMRNWSAGPTVVFVMLNPSTAGATRNDPTVRRCINLSRAWGFGRLELVNLFAWRSAHPVALRRAVDPVGPANGRTIWQALRRADLIVLAWGNHGGFMQAGPKLLEKLARTGLCDRLACVGVTLRGHPRHVLYVPKHVRPMPFVVALASTAEPTSLQ